MNLAIAIPTYNEAKNINKLLPAIAKSIKDYPDLKTTVFIIDDNSPDGTSDISKRLSNRFRYPNFKIKVIDRAKKEGLGKAYIFGFKKIMAQNFDFILQMDADLSHDPMYLPQFIDATSNADLVVGSRYVKGGATPDWQWYRKLLSHGGNIYTRYLLSTRISDYTGGFNIFSTELLRKINIDSLQASGYGFLIELKYKALNESCNVVQIPIVFMDRRHGNSKIPRGIILNNLLLVLRLRMGLIDAP